MQSTPVSTEGIILQNTPYRNEDQILTLFTKDRGVIKLFCNKKASKKIHFSPVMNVEIIFRERKSEIWACDEISIIQSYLNLRGQLSHLQVACDMILTIQKSQWIGRPAPQLYQLFLFYLNRITHVSDPWILAASLKLKILKYEGLLTPDSFAQNDFEKNDIDLLLVLAFTQDFKALTQFTLPTELKEKIHHLFLETLEN